MMQSFLSIFMLLAMAVAPVMAQPEPPTSWTLIDHNLWMHEENGMVRVKGYGPIALAYVQNQLMAQRNRLEAVGVPA